MKELTERMHHRVIVPKFSSVHRYACLALYRALLRQCSKLPRAAPQLVAAQPHIRQRFRRYKDLQSPSQTANALKAGYEALDLLSSASQGNQNDANAITATLSEAQSIKQQKRELQTELAKRRSVKQLSPKQIKKQENQRLQKMTARRHPEATSILSRPRPVVDGRRRVPALVNALGVPFLRIKKPQPNFLSGIIRTKAAKRWKMILCRERLDVEYLFGEDEDKWDTLTIGREPETWTSEIDAALKDVNFRIKQTDLKRKALAKSMWEIVLAERKLAEEEENQRSSET